MGHEITGLEQQTRRSLSYLQTDLKLVIDNIQMDLYEKGIEKLIQHILLASSSG